MEKLGLNLGYLIVQILNFAVIALVLYAWVYKPLLGMLQKRRESVAQGLEDARVAAEARANAEQEANRIITEAQVKANELVRDATERAEAAAREVRNQAEAESSKARDNARAELDLERNLMLTNLRSQVVALSVAATRKLIGDTLGGSETQQKALLEEFFSGIRKGKLQLLNGEKLSGETVEVTSALPLSNDEQETIKKELSSSTGNSVTVQFRVDPSILGGLVLRAGDRVIDGSISAKLQELETSLR